MGLLLLDVIEYGIPQPLSNLGIAKCFCRGSLKSVNVVFLAGIESASS